MKYSVQLNAKGKLQHLLTIEGLSRSHLLEILDRANEFLSFGKKIELKNKPILKGKSIFNIFFENSTRTSTTFEIAAKRLSADVLKLNMQNSSVSKGESLLDTIDNLIAMQADMFVIRHPSSGAAHLIADHVNSAAPEIKILNAGDGSHSHPTQALLDAYTIKCYKKKFGALKVAIVGDIEHSRVAKSEIYILNKLGVQEVRVIGPELLMPSNISELNVRSFSNMNDGLKDVDAILMLRIQKERMSKDTIPSEKEYFKAYGLNEERLKFAKNDCIVLHPGPINRGVEIDTVVADGRQSVILEQVKNGIGIRMAVMEKMAN